MEIDRLFDTKEVKALVTSLKEREDEAKVEVVDTVYWMKGCSSLGRLRFAVLLSVGKNFCLIDIKEATRAVATAYESADTPTNHAQRIVAGERALSPYLGQRTLPARFSSKPVVLRDL